MFRRGDQPRKDLLAASAEARQRRSQRGRTGVTTIERMERAVELAKTDPLRRAYLPEVADEKLCLRVTLAQGAIEWATYDDGIWLPVTEDAAVHILTERSLYLVEPGT